MSGAMTLGEDEGLPIQEALRTFGPPDLIRALSDCEDAGGGPGLLSVGGSLTWRERLNLEWRGIIDQLTLHLEAEARSGRIEIIWPDPSKPTAAPDIIARQRVRNLQAGAYGGDGVWIGGQSYPGARFRLVRPLAPAPLQVVATDDPAPVQGGVPQPAKPRRRTALYLIAEKLFPEMEALISSGKCVGDSAEWQAAGLVSARAGGSDKGEVRQKRLHKWFKEWREEQEPYSKAL